MTPLTFATWIVVAVVTACGATVVMKVGGHGMKADILLGLAGSGSACVTAWSLDMFPAPALAATAIVAFSAVVAVITLQRRFFYAPLGEAHAGSTWKN